MLLAQRETVQLLGPTTEQPQRRDSKLTYPKRKKETQFTAWKFMHVVYIPSSI